MARRARLLIYDGPEDWIRATKEREFIRLGRKELGEGKSITCVELNPAELTLFECKLEELEELEEEGRSGQ